MKSVTFWSILMVRVHNGLAEAAANQWVRRRTIEEAAETVPGFRHGQVLISADEPDLVCVICGWANKAAYEEWLSSPVRAKQATDLSEVVSADAKTLFFENLHTVSKMGHL
jgi:heme-degrading monooxygenase HmoA